MSTSANTTKATKAPGQEHAEALFSIWPAFATWFLDALQAHEFDVLIPQLYGVTNGKDGRILKRDRHWTARPFWRNRGNDLKTRDPETFMRCQGLAERYVHDVYAAEGLPGIKLTWEFFSGERQC